MQPGIPLCEPVALGTGKSSLVTSEDENVGGERGVGTASGVAAGCDGSPSLSISSNCITYRENHSPSRLSTHQKNVAELLHLTIKNLAEKHGIERIGFLTLTFEERGIPAQEAQRRWRSLRTNVLNKRYPKLVKVKERQQDGTIHYHVVCVLPVDIRTGVNFEEFKERRYGSASKALKAEWAFWRRTCKSYGFGRHELLPVKSTAEGIARYVGKYISKDVAARLPEDKGARMVEYSKRARIGTTRFARVSVRSWLWRHKVAEFAKKHGCADLDELRALCGSRWAHNMREQIMDTPLSYWPSGAHYAADRCTSGDVPLDAGPVRQTGGSGLSGKQLMKKALFSIEVQELREFQAAYMDGKCVPWSPVPLFEPRREAVDPAETLPPWAWKIEIVKDYLGNVIKGDNGKPRWRRVLHEHYRHGNTRCITERDLLANLIDTSASSEHGGSSPFLYKTERTYKLQRHIAFMPKRA